MPLDLITNTADPQQRGLIVSILEGGIAPFPNFTRNDTSVAIRIMPVVPSTTDTRSFDVDYVSGDTYQVSIGSADEAPSAGTFALEIDGVTTDLTSLDFDVSAEDLEDALSAASVAGGNPALTVTLLSEGVYQVDGATVGVIPTIAATATNLIPNCSAVVTVISQGTVSTKGQQIIALVQQPAAYATPSTALPTASVTASTEQAASSSANKIVRIAFAAGTYGGLYSITATANGVTAICGSVSPVASVGELSSVLGRHPQLRYNNPSAPNNFTVSTDGAAYLVEFNGNLIGPADPSLAVTNVSLLAPFGASGTISLNTVNMAKMFWASGVDSLALTLSVVRTRTSGEVKTILSIPVTIPADIINAGSLATLSVPGAVRYDISQSLSASEKLQAVTNQGLNLTASKLLGQASSGGTGLPVAITLGTNLSMSGTTLNTQADRYLTSSTTSLTIANGTQSLTVGTGLAYTTQQDITIAYNASNHMHATVTSYDSGTGAMVVDVQGKAGSGTYAVWTVNVGGIAAGVIPTGGTTGQVLNKASGSNYDVQWGPTVTGSGTLTLSTYTLTVAGTASISGTNTGDQTVGTIATQDANNVAITGGTISNFTFLFNGASITNSDQDDIAGTTLRIWTNNCFVSVANGGGIGVGTNTLLEALGGFDISLTATANTSLTLPLSGTLLSTADIGVSVQAYDADLTTWAGITPGANVGAFLATPSGANLASALTSALPVGAGGTGVSTSGTTSQIAVGGGTGSAIVWTTATGTGAPVRAIAPAFTGAPTISGNTSSPNGTVSTIGDELWSLHRVRQIGAFLFGNTGTSSVGTETGARGGAAVNSGSSTSGYGRATLAHAFNQTSSAGGGIRFNKAISVAVVAGIYCGVSTTSRTRLVVGGNGGVPATADANALAVVGFGVEFRFLSGEDCECQLFAHNGTTYATSGWSGSIAGGLNRMTAFIVASDGSGNIALYLSYGTGAAGRPSSTAILTLAGGPTTQGNTTNNRIDWIATNDSTGSPSGSISTLFSALLDTP